MGATPRAVICFRCASIHRRSSSVLMPAARAIWSLVLVSLRSPLDVPYGAARNGGGGSGECGWCAGGIWRRGDAFARENQIKASFHLLFRSMLYF